MNPFAGSPIGRLAVSILLLILAAPCLAADKEGWVSLFDGKSLNGWTTSDKKPVSKGWVAEEGLLVRKEKGGDIYTDREYANFIFEFEWRMAPNGNSGVKYRMTHYGKEYLGPEYQCFDDGPAGKPRLSNPKQLTASIYELFAPSAPRTLNPPGQWNRGRIVANGTKLEHWLNGQLVAQADTSSDAWKQAVAASKFAKKGNFGENPSGRIMLQDHGSEIAFRNLRLKPLP